jgi:mannose-6-phosphate isomerase-like protein (cupin superfamily)
MPGGSLVKRAFHVSEGVQGDLLANGGKFNLLVDRERGGAQHFSLLLNEIAPNYSSTEHQHDVEHCWFILSGRGRMFMEGQEWELKPDVAVFAPALVPHRIESYGPEPLRYLVIYAPPGPEQDLLQKGYGAFNEPKS